MCTIKIGRSESDLPIFGGRKGGKHGRINLWQTLLHLHLG